MTKLTSKVALILTLFLILGLFLATLFTNSTNSPDPQAKAKADYGSLPLSFEDNVGQVDPSVEYVAKGGGYNVFLRPNDLTLALPTDKISQAKPSTVTLNWLSSNSQPIVSGLEQLPGKVNYFIGNDANKWRTNITTYGKIRYENIYKGIDLFFYGDQQQLEYDFVVAPGASVGSIQLGFSGVDGLTISDQGDLLLEVGGKQIVQRIPFVYQTVNGLIRKIDAQYRLQQLANSPTVTFEIDNYDHSLPLTIDPILAYSTFLGGSGSDIAADIALDAAGNAYVTGTTNSINYPVFGNPYDSTYNAAFDGFVSKLNAAGTALIYSTYIGGVFTTDEFAAIAVDNVGNAYLTGIVFYNTATPPASPADYPVTPGAFDTTHNDYYDVFVTKLNASGSSLVYSSYLGGYSREFATRITVDAAGSAYVTGYTNSEDNMQFNRPFPTTTGAYRTTISGSYDAFVTKFNPAGTALVFSTFLGGSLDDEGRGIAVDSTGNIYVAGAAASEDFPTTGGAYDTTYNGGLFDGFAAKLNSTGTNLLYSTLLGGQATDYATGLALHSDNNLYVVGTTASTDYPTTAGAYDSTLDQSDVFITRLNSTGSSLVYSTLFGGSGADSSPSIQVDASGAAYIAGRTESANLPIGAGTYDPAYNGGTSDAFVARFNNTGTALTYSSYLGGDNNDEAMALAVDADGNAYVVGTTSSPNFPTTTGAYDTTFNSTDLFVSKLQLWQVVGNVAPTGVNSLEVALTKSVSGDTIYFGFSSPTSITVPLSLPPLKNGVNLQSDCNLITLNGNSNQQLVLNGNNQLSGLNFIGISLKAMLGNNRLACVKVTTR